MTAGPNRPVLIRQVNFVWDAVALLPLAGLFVVSAYDYLPMLVGLGTVFLTFFWLFSFGFAVYAKLRKPKDPGR